MTSILSWNTFVAFVFRQWYHSAQVRKQPCLILKHTLFMVIAVALTTTRGRFFIERIIGCFGMNAQTTHGWSFEEVSQHTLLCSEIWSFLRICSRLSFISRLLCFPFFFFVTQTCGTLPASSSIKQACKILIKPWSFIPDWSNWQCYNHPQSPLLLPKGACLFGCSLSHSRAGWRVTNRAVPVELVQIQSLVMDTFWDAQQHEGQCLSIFCATDNRILQAILVHPLQQDSHRIYYKYKLKLSLKCLQSCWLQICVNIWNLWNIFSDFFFN